MMRKFFIFALLFFVATILVAGIIFMGGTNFISSKNVEISVVGPTAVGAGEPVELGLTIENSNNSDLQAVKLSIQYPSGARNAENTGESLTFVKEDIGTISAGDEVARPIKMVLIGSPGEQKNIKFSVEYKVKGSNAIFYKDKLYEMEIGHAPLNLTIQSPSSVTSGDEFTMKLNLALNSTEPLKNVMVRAEYPYGFTFASSQPQPVANGNVWSLGDFPAGKRATIELKGRLSGENQEERTFRFYVGVSDNGSMNPDFKTVVVSNQNTVRIARPSLGLNISFNGENAATYIAPAGRSVSVSIRYQNNLPERLLNPTLIARLSGAALDKASVSPQNGGVYDASNSRVSWALSNSSGERELEPGEGGTVNMTLASVPLASLGSNKDIALSFALAGSPVGSGGTNPISVSESRMIRVSSQVTLASNVYHTIGPFKNSGPIPPKVGEETTYTVVWNAGNTQDDIMDAKVTARLGSGVRWILANSAGSESISYNSSANTITWDLGRLASGTGFSSGGREVAFQIALKPSLAQLGTTPVLVSAIALSGQDSVRGSAVNINAPVLTTRLPNDPAFIQGNDIVVNK